MKGFNCPNCGKRQSVKLDTPSRVLIPCPECGRSLLVKMDKEKWSVAVDETMEAGQDVSIPPRA